MLPTTRTLATLCAATLCLATLAACQNTGTGTVPQTPTASQGGGAAVVQGGTSGAANARSPSP